MVGVELRVPWSVSEGEPWRAPPSSPDRPHRPPSSHRHHSTAATTITAAMRTSGWPLARLTLHLLVLLARSYCSLAEEPT